MSNPDKDFPASNYPFTTEVGSTVTPGFDEPVSVTATGPCVLDTPSRAYDHLESWPPLSEEQMAELYAALVAFLQRTAAGVDLEPAAAWSAAYDLRNELLHLGIGTPPTTKRWSGDQLQQATEEMQEFEPLASVRLTNPQGREADLLQGRPGDVLTAHLRAFGVVPEPVRKNCRACRHNQGEFGCGVIAGFVPGVATVASICRWLRSAAPTGRISSCPPDADGCPGWERKP